MFGPSNPYAATNLWHRKRYLHALMELGVSEEYVEEMLEVSPKALDAFEQRADDIGLAGGVMIDDGLRIIVFPSSHNDSVLLALVRIEFERV